MPFTREVTTCNRCRNHKRRCDRQKPACSRCAKIGATCIFPNNAKNPASSSISASIGSNPTATNNATVNAAASARLKHTPHSYPQMTSNLDGNNRINVTQAPVSSEKSTEVRIRPPPRPAGDDATVSAPPFGNHPPNANDATGSISVNQPYPLQNLQRLQQHLQQLHLQQQQQQQQQQQNQQPLHLQLQPPQSPTHPHSQSRSNSISAATPFSAVTQIPSTSLLSSDPPLLTNPLLLANSPNDPSNSNGSIANSNNLHLELHSPLDPDSQASLLNISTTLPPNPYSSHLSLSNVRVQNDPVVDITRTDSMNLSGNNGTSTIPNLPPSIVPPIISQNIGEPTNLTVVTTTASTTSSTPSITTTKTSPLIPLISNNNNNAVVTGPTINSDINLLRGTTPVPSPLSTVQTNNPETHIDNSNHQAPFTTRSPPNDIPASTAMPAGGGGSMPFYVPKVSLSSAQRPNRTIRKRNRISLSCIRCHRQKVKCDKKQPCSRCKMASAEDECIYHSRREMLEFVPLEDDPSQVLRTWHSRHRGFSHWRGLLAKVGMENPIGEGVHIIDALNQLGQNVCDHSQDPVLVDNFPFAAQNSFKFSTSASILSLIRELGPKIINEYVDAYISVFEPLYPVVSPTFRDEVSLFLGSQQNVSNHGWMAEFLMVLGIGCVTVSEQNVRQAHNLMTAASVCFMQTHFVLHPTLSTVRTLCLIVIAKSVINPTCMATDSSWTLLGFLVRICVTLGLHQERAPVSRDALSPEDFRNWLTRRNLWVTALYLDTESAMLTGMPSMIRKDEIVFDNGAISLIPADKIDVITLQQSLLYSSFPKILEVVARVNTPDNPLSYSEALEFNLEVRQLMTRAASCLRGFSAVAVEIFFRRALLVIHRQFAHHMDAPTYYATSYWSSLECCLALLILHRKVCSADSEFRPAHIVVNIYMLDFLAAALTACIHLMRPDAPLSSSVPSLIPPPLPLAMSTSLDPLQALHLSHHHPNGDGGDDDDHMTDSSSGLPLRFQNPEQQQLYTQEINGNHPGRTEQTQSSNHHHNASLPLDHQSIDPYCVQLYNFTPPQDLSRHLEETQAFLKAQIAGAHGPHPSPNPPATTSAANPTPTTTTTTGSSDAMPAETTTTSSTTTPTNVGIAANATLSSISGDGSGASQSPSVSSQLPTPSDEQPVPPRQTIVETLFFCLEIWANVQERSTCYRMAHRCLEAALTLMLISSSSSDSPDAIDLETMRDRGIPVDLALPLDL